MKRVSDVNALGGPTNLTPNQFMPASSTPNYMQPQDSFGNGGIPQPQTYGFQTSPQVMTNPSPPPQAQQYSNFGQPQQPMAAGFPQQQIPSGFPQQQQMPSAFPQQQMPSGFPQSQMPGFNPQFSMFQQPIVQDMAMQYGQKLADQGKQMVESTFERWIPVTKLKYYFAVDNNYVINKLRLIFFPFMHKVSFIRI